MYSYVREKLINCGEGGILTCNHDDLIKKCILMSGSYGHFARHKSRPSGLSDMNGNFAATPHFSMRLNRVGGALAKSQLSFLSKKILKFNSHWQILKEELETQCLGVGNA
jgi:dTDP-4-amino-4,6-dideoxygalactose transaminase